MIRAKEELDAVDRHLIDSSASVEEDASAGWVEGISILEVSICSKQMIPHQ